MSKREWNRFYKKVKQGDILIIPKDKRLKYNKGLPDYEAEVLKVCKDGIITTLVDDPLRQPIAWECSDNRNYTFAGAKIKS